MHERLEAGTSPAAHIQQAEQDRVRRPASAASDVVASTRPVTSNSYAGRPDGRGAPEQHTPHDEATVRGLMFDTMNTRGEKLDGASAKDRFEKNPHRNLDSDVTRELQTGIPGTFGVRHLRAGETLHSRSDPDRDNGGHYSSPQMLGREEAVQGHALAWTSQGRDVQHSRSHAYEVGPQGAGPVLMSAAAPQTHKTHEVDGQGERLPGGREQYMHPKGLYGTPEEQAAKGLTKVGDVLDDDVSNGPDGWQRTTN